MACVLTRLVSDIKLSSPPSPYMGHQHLPPQHSQPQQLSDDDRDSKRRRASDSDAAAAPSQLMKGGEQTDSQPSTPSSPSSPPTSPPLLSSDSKSTPSSSSSAASNGNSCHQCKTAKDANLLLFCTSAAEKGVRKRRCRKKYCESCLRRSYNPEVAFPSEQWVCPSCQGFCVCAACSRGVDGCEREGLTGAMATLSQMNPLILALLGVDERKLAQLQAVINTPQLLSVSDSAQAGLLASMLASASTYSVAAQPLIGPAVLAGVPGAALGTPAMAGVNSVGLGMQELNLNHQYEQAAIMPPPVSLLSMPPGSVGPYQVVDDPQLRLPVPPYMEAVGPLHSVRSNASTTSTATSPYGNSSAYSSSSGTNSSSSSPLLRSALSGQQSATTSLLSMPPLAPLPNSVTGTPNNSPRIVSRSHTQPQPPVESIEHSPAMQRQRLFSHPPLPPLSSSTPTMSRILPQPSEHSPHMVHDLSPSHTYSVQSYPQPLSRKRSYSTTVADSDSNDVSRHRFVLPPHIVQQAQIDHVSRVERPVAAELSVKAEVAQYDSQWSQQQQQHPLQTPLQQQQQPTEHQPFVLEHEMEMRKRLAEAAWKQEAEVLYNQQATHGHHEVAGELLLHFDHAVHPATGYPSSHPAY